MKYNHHNNKGFTLLELLIVLGIVGIITTAIFSFFLSNLKTFHRANDQIEAQYNAQNAMNKLVDYIIEAEGIEGPLTTPITFKMSADKIIQIDYVDNSLNYREGENATAVKTDPYTFASNITRFTISSLTNDKGVNIDITSTKNDAVVNLSNQVYFRNAR